MSRRAVLVTGASSGIGEATALELARIGFRVYAGVRKDADAERLAAAAAGELVAVELDVTEPAQIAAAAERVGDECPDGLVGLVNNAGIPVTGPLEFVPLERIRRQLEVNLIGQLAVTRAALPALRTARGRVVNVTSIGGLVATPFYGPYCASKFALEAVSDCLRIELRPWGIRTIAIEPGSIATSIWDRGNAAAAELRRDLDPAAEELYGKAMDRAVEIGAETGARGIEPIAVARVIHKALTARRPRARYLVGADARGMALASRLLPDRLWDRVAARALGLP